MTCARDDGAGLEELVRGRRRGEEEEEEEEAEEEEEEEEDEEEEEEEERGRKRRRKPILCVSIVILGVLWLGVFYRGSLLVVG